MTTGALPALSKAAADGGDRYQKGTELEGEAGDVPEDGALTPDACDVIPRPEMEHSGGELARTSPAGAEESDKLRTIAAVPARFCARGRRGGQGGARGPNGGSSHGPERRNRRVSSAG